MFALIKKENALLKGRKWLVGFNDKPANIVLRFMNSGVKDALQETWMVACCDDNNDTAEVLRLNEAANNGNVTRSQVENIDYRIGNWHYTCVGVAETNEEANAICDYLESENPSKKRVDSITIAIYDQLLELLRTRFPDVPAIDIYKCLDGIEDLSLENSITL